VKALCSSVLACLGTASAGFARVQNLLLSAQFLLKICDFGFAAKNDPASPLKTECGTKSYMAPEVMTGRGYDGAKADIFSCGVILFIILTGFPPFQAPLATDWWFHKLMTKQHDLFWQAHCRSAFFTPEAKDLLNKMLEPVPDHRITVAGIRFNFFSHFSNLYISRGRYQIAMTKRNTGSADHPRQEYLFIVRTTHSEAHKMMPRTSWKYHRAHPWMAGACIAYVVVRCWVSVSFGCLVAPAAFSG
jgi:serine/threonine protein kinase